MTQEQVEGLIREGLPDAEIDVLGDRGDGNHFQAVIVSPSFRGKSLVQRHQLVYSTLGGALKEDIHALSLQTYTPEEAE